MARFELLDEIDLPFPLGGCFGCWGYDLKNFTEPKLPRRAVNDLELPDCHVGLDVYKRQKLSGGGRPSGPLSFLKVYDQVANVVKSGGKTRRAAKMNTLRDWHGDIEEFIDCKQKEEKKAWALIEQGYDGSYNGDAYGSVMYQNENLSVRVSDEFMQAAMTGKEWWTRTITTNKPLEKKCASRLLEKIAEGTHICGDPGLQYDGAIQKWHTCKGTEPIHSTNPCSEYVFINNTCLLYTSRCV